MNEPVQLGSMHRLGRHWGRGPKFCLVLGIVCMASAFYPARESGFEYLHSMIGRGTLKGVDNVDRSLRGNPWPLAARALVCLTLFAGGCATFAERSYAAKPIALIAILTAFCVFALGS
jgi:hypothetical protein